MYFRFVVESYGSSVACALRRKSVARPVTDPRQWDLYLREALGKRRERVLGQHPGSYTEAPDRSDATNVFVEFARAPGTSVKLAGSTYILHGWKEGYTRTDRSTIPETPHLCPSVVSQHRLIRDSVTGALFFDQEWAGGGGGGWGGMANIATPLIGYTEFVFLHITSTCI